MSRVEKGNDGTYHIRNVVAADEWAENVDDNAYTNGVAKLNLKAASKAAKLLGEPIVQEWNKVSEGLVILSFPDGVTREHAQYDGENIKQADVTLLAYPLKLITNSTRIEKDLAYYETRVPEKTPQP